MPELRKQDDDSLAQAGQSSRERGPLRLHGDAWLPLASILCLFVAVGTLYWPSAVALDSIWRSTIATYQDGYLVLLASLWLIVRDRKRLAATPVQPTPPALLAVATLSLAWLWAWRAAIQELHMELVPLLLFAAVWAALGRKMARLLVFPLGFLYFALPIWDHIRHLLQALSAHATAGLVWITGLSAYVRGDFIHLPWGTLHIEGGCSGLNTLIVLLALTTLYTHVNGVSWRRQLKLLSIATILALLVNWLRIFVITVVAYYSEMRSSLVENHKWFGWLLFVLAFAGFLLWMERAGPRDIAPAPVEPERPPDTGLGVRPLPLGLTLAALGFLPLLSYGMDRVHSIHAESSLMRIEWPIAVAPWSGPQPERSLTWTPRFVNSSGESLVEYATSQGFVQAFDVTYRIQTQDHKLLGYRNTLFSGAAQMHIISQRTVMASKGSWRETLLADPSGQRALIWSRVRIGMDHFTDPRLAQMWYGLVALVQPPLSSLLALRTPCIPTCRAAQARLRSLSPWLHPAFR